MNDFKLKYLIRSLMSGSYQDTTVSHSDAIGLGGSTQVVSNMPPYLTVYVWKRTA